MLLLTVVMKQLQLYRYFGTRGWQQKQSDKTKAWKISCFKRPEGLQIFTRLGRVYLDIKFSGEGWMCNPQLEIKLSISRRLSTYTFITTGGCLAHDHVAISLLSICFQVVPSPVPHHPCTKDMFVQA